MKLEQTQTDTAAEQIALSDLLEGAATFYQNPINRQAFEVWKKSKEAQNYANLIHSRTDP